MQSSAQFGDIVLGCITCSIYTPLTVEVQCAGGSAYLLEPDVEEGVTWVSPTEMGVK